MSGGAALSVHGEGPILSHAWPVSHDELKGSIAGVLYCIVSGGGDGIGEPQKVKG